MPRAAYAISIRVWACVLGDAGDGSRGLLSGRGFVVSCRRRVPPPAWSVVSKYQNQRISTSDLCQSVQEVEIYIFDQRSRSQFFDFGPFWEGAKKAKTHRMPLLFALLALR